MQNLLDAITAFTSGSTIGVYLFIFFGKILEVSLSTLRSVLINRGIRLAGSLVAIVEYLLWLFITASVLTGYKEDFLKAVALTLAYATGNYLGSWLDEKLAFGLCQATVLLPSCGESKQVAELLRENKFGLTVLDGKGMDDTDKEVLLLTMKRKRMGECASLINSVAPEAVITISQASSFSGGYLGNPASRLLGGPFRRRITNDK